MSIQAEFPDFEAILSTLAAISISPEFANHQNA